ncbi:MAG: 2'-deoxycytidine 5'-triphosphate deaminase [Alphaproteobacteria bacterium]|nr:2'-deoxycytidine 5'-triphosphate deaminase [Alphaproteobacteria bacterium]
MFSSSDDPPAAPAGDHSTGVLPSQALRQAIADHEILAAPEIEESQIQPASLDLRLAETAWRVRASFLPGRHATVHDKLDQLAMHRIDLTGGAVLEKGCVYIVKLVENVALRRRMTALANPKSSTGRLDVFARVITDHGSEFDRIREGYKGPLYVEIAPRTFSVLVRAGSRLVQLRVRRGSPVFGDVTLRRLNEQVQLMGGEGLGDYIEDGRVNFTVDVTGAAGNGLVGYRARKHAGLIDVDKEGFYAPDDFWEPIPARPGQGVGLDPGDFYILASRERVVVPPDHAAEMLAYDTFVGEFRVHYAGFFDPGFGHDETGGEGSRAVLEVRSHEVPFLVEDGQVVGRLVYERLLARPDKLYGAGIGSSYQRQGLALGKQFKR